MPAEAGIGITLITNKITVYIYSNFICKFELCNDFFLGKKERKD
ncbi:hypothetical protein VPUCM_p0012 (plasmid) [Vibrio parahaemolyticus UCM-V493]|nr:hypothetical protein VPUCM_p0012 [Vibrio parahaemolyticus UCM-V493]